MAASRALIKRVLEVPNRVYKGAKLRIINNRGVKNSPFATHEAGQPMTNTLIIYLLRGCGSLLLLGGICTNALSVPIGNTSPAIEHQSLSDTIDQYQIDGLNRALAMDSQLSTKVMAIINNNKQQRAMLQETYKKQMTELKKVINTATSLEIATLITDLEQTIKEMQTLYMKKWNALKVLLTEKQQARYLLYQDALQRELQRRAIEGLERGTSERK
ncbi:MAG: hypothetical protein KZQ82_09780 [Candidatus Thiodiazotropha sp. (ex Lucinoma annulata)]|nr:hypothetical protein [Candidatus Thiodiazotropha sp. (ex Troendleina suluensis)]MCU7865918.1 hypothetical protein [Candidatus Thiodiazotropha sp. (ex Lucinoma borealis)]MCU7884475.1 hypothetical protein [Candidatus Thiodiazotropha sp. (ex Lucinoma annulata)]